MFTGSGIYKQQQQQQQQDTYTQLTEGESVYITEDTTLVCVSSIPSSSSWYYDNTSTGVEERLIEGTEMINSRGFLTLSLQTTSRVGRYFCRTMEIREDTYVTGSATHSIIVSVPIVTTTTPIPTTSALTTTEPIDATQTATKSTTTSGIILQETNQTAPPQTTTTTTTTTNGTQTELEDTTPPYPIIGLTIGVLFILMLVIVVVILIIAFVVHRRKAKRSGYTKQIQTNNTEDTTTDVNNNKEYVNLPNLPTKPVPPSNTKKPVYKKLLQTDTPITSPIESTPEDKDGYMTLDQLEGSIGVGGESNPCVKEKVIPNNEMEYENVRLSLYESTTAKYTHDPCATLVPLSQFKRHLSHLLGESRLEKEYRQLEEQDLRYECSHCYCRPIISLRKNSARNFNSFVLTTGSNWPVCISPSLTPRHVSA